jgi:uncharacterized delta-60 repeat protein
MSRAFVKSTWSLRPFLRSALAVCAFLGFGGSKAFPQAGALDTTFAPPFTANINMESRALAELPDGRILVGLTQNSFSVGPNEVYLARLNPNGSPISLEVPFPGVFTNTGRDVSVLSVLENGKVLVGGMFRLGTNTSQSTLTRLNSDGAWDTSFDHAAIGGRLWCVTLQNDGRILIGGQFSHVHGVPRTNIARLNVDGSLDASFMPEEIGGMSLFVPGQVRGIAIQTDNKILIAGEFGSVGGIARWNIARLNADGSHDQSFDPAAMFGRNGGRQNAQSLTLDENGRILICGQFARFDNEPRLHVARLQTNGLLDTSFSAPLHGDSVVVHRAIVEAGGKIIIAGGFTTTGAVVRADVARLNNDGSVDASFDAGNIESSVSRLIRQQDGKYLLGGHIAAVNGVPRAFVARLMGDNLGGPGKIQFLAPTFRTAEDGPSPAQLIVSRSDGRSGAVAATFSTRTGTANVIDFGMTNGIVQFADGEFAPRTIDITIADDPLQENAEEFTVVLENPQGGAALGQPSSATVTISANDYAGSVDTSFAPGVAARGPPSFSVVNALLLQPDGKVVVGGRFIPDDGTNGSHFTRLNGDGSVDLSFDPGAGPDSEVTALASQPDGRIFVGGNFSSFNGTNANGLVRLESNGALDRSFSAGQGADGSILALAVEATGTILVGGEFDTFNGSNRVGLARLSAAGVVQPLDVQLSGDGWAYVQSIVPTTNGVYVGGVFERAGGLARNGLFRLRTDGSVDPDFRAATVTNQYDLGGDYTFNVYSIFPLADGDIFVGGDFYEVDGETRHGIVRLNGDGSLDRAFVPEFDDDSYILSIHRLANGNLYVGGSFDLPTLPYWVDGIARLHADGRIDWSFEPALIDGFVNAVVLEPDRQIIFGGHFDECAHTVRHNLARVNVETLPLLAIEQLQGGNVRVSWPESLRNLILEGADGFDSASWSRTAAAILSDGRYNHTNAIGGGRRFYRTVASP